MSKASRLLKLLEQELTQEEAVQLIEYGMKTGQVDMVKRALLSGKLNSTWSIDELFLKAIKDGNIELITFFMNHYKINPNIRLDMGKTPLHFASQSGNINLIKYLLDNGADVNALGYIGKTPLHYASAKGDANVVKLLIDYGASIDIKDEEERTPLQYLSSAYVQNIEVAKLLLEHGADANSIDMYGNSPLHNALRSGFDKIAGLLKQYGGVDIEDKTDYSADFEEPR